MSVTTITAVTDASLLAALSGEATLGRGVATHRVWPFAFQLYGSTNSDTRGPRSCLTFGSTPQTSRTTNVFCALMTQT